MSMDAIGDWLAAQGNPGAVLGVARRGEIVHLAAYGTAGVDDTFWIASMTKPLTTIAALTLVEEGHLDLQADIADYLPEFADRHVLDGTTPRPAARQPTVLDLLRHTSGIVEGLLGDTPAHKLYVEAVGNGMTDLTGAEFATRLAALPFAHDPGTTWHYGWGLDLVGFIIERLTNHTLADYLTARVLTPLGMTNTTFDANRPLFAPDQLPDLTRARFASGGAGLVSTTTDYLRFATFLLHGTSEIIGGNLRHHMTTDRLDPGTDRAMLDRMEPGHTFGLGLAVRETGPGTPGEITWPGAAGTMWWADPAEDLAAVFLTHTWSDETNRMIRETVRREFL